MINIQHKMTGLSHKWGDIVAAVGAGAGWTAVIHGTLQIATLVFTFLLTGISLYLAVPKFVKRLREDVAILRGRQASQDEELTVEYKKDIEEQTKEEP
jgi:hypothetical protein